MYSMKTQWLRLDTAFIAVASHARASAARAISTAALSASVTGTRIAPCVGSKQRTSAHSR
jgi:hypothetical protein